MSQQQTLIEEALQYAIGRGIKINRGGAVFNWCHHIDNYNSVMVDTPVSCNAMGAVLLKLGKENMVKESFDPEWLKVLSKYLGVDPFWINRFVLGFDYGTQIELIEVDKEKKEKERKDEISRLGAQLAARYVAKV